MKGSINGEMERCQTLYRDVRLSIFESGSATMIGYDCRTTPAGPPNT
jgi:hypothetical protein